MIESRLIATTLDSLYRIPTYITVRINPDNGSDSDEFCCELPCVMNRGMIISIKDNVKVSQRNAQWR